jgi:hypothetical protein
MATNVRTGRGNTRTSADGGSWGIRGGSDAGGDRRIELVGDDGTVTTLCQHPDGTLEIRTAAMLASGRAVRVPPTGAAVEVVTDTFRN